MEPTVEEFGQSEDVQARKLSEFFINLLENHLTTVRYYLADNVVLDWFGKTIRNEKKVAAYLRDTVGNVTHHITRTVPAESVAFRESHHVKLSKAPRPPLIVPLSPAIDKDPITPPRQAQPSTSMLEIGQGDGFHNNNNGMSPLKKPKLSEDSTETVEGEPDSFKMKYVTSEGDIEFRRASIKKFQTETKWKRPFKLHLGYTGTGHKDCTIYLIIYEGNVKCRRNLLKDFCESESGND